MIDVRPAVLIVLGVVAAFIVLSYFSLWGGVILLTALCLALGVYGFMVDG